MMSPVPLSRFLGAFLGQAIADAAGAFFEGVPPGLAFDLYGPIDERMRYASEQPLHYTDDTEMLLGVAETLIEHGQIVHDTLCRRFVANFHRDRRYGPGTYDILEGLEAGGDWRVLNRSQFPGGSYGNGAAMRVAPVGLLFCRDPTRAVEQAELSALPTHVHPWGVEGARLLAAAVAHAARSEQLDRGAFFAELFTHCREDEFRWRLELASQLGPQDSLAHLGSGIAAHESVITAITCFAAAPDDYLEAISRAIAQGDDTDTLAAMTGAISGAYLGVEGVPASWIERLENTGKGRDYLVQLARELHARYLGQSGGDDLGS